jgi:hypothetical protein
LKYWVTIEPWVFTPNSACSARSEAPFSDGNLVSIVSTALPGMTRGIAKLIVTAAHTATT